MKAIKKITSILICLALVCSCAIFASAATTGSITIKDPENSSATIDGKSFDIYQVFSAETNGSTTSYAWVEDKNGDPAFYDFFFGATDPAIATKSNGTVVEAVEYIAGLYEDNGINFQLSQLAEKFYTYIVGKNATTTVIEPVKSITKTETAGKSEITVDGLEYGYYLIYDSSDLSGGAVRSAVMLSNVTTDATVTLKANRPQMAKYVLENDGVTYGKATSSDIGDVVDFKIELIVPSHNHYEDYTYYVEDALPESMELVDGSIVVKLTNNGTTTTLTKDTDYTLPTPSENADFKVDFTGDNRIDNTTKYPVNSKIEIFYQATINAKMEAGVANKNNATLTYSNDPAKDTTGSVTDSANVYTYSFVLTKFAEDAHGNFSNQTRLAGAQFEIYKKGETTPIKFITKTANEVYGGTDTYTVYVVAPNGAADTTTTLTVLDGTAPAEDVLSANYFGGNLGDITVFGLSEGVYEIKEIVAPEGYYLADANIEFTITDTTDDSGLVSNLTASGSYPSDAIGSIGNANGSAKNLLTWIDFANQHGDALPETGGIGTTVFTLAGVILMAGAFAFFTSRKRSRAV